MWVDTCWPVHSNIAILIVLSLAPRSAASATAPPPIIAASTAATLHRSLLRRMVSASDDCLVFAVLLPCRSRLSRTHPASPIPDGRFIRCANQGPARLANQAETGASALPAAGRNVLPRRPIDHSTAGATGEFPLPRRDMAQLR